MLASLPVSDRAVIARAVADAERVAARVAPDIHAVARALRVADEEHRVKTAASIARKVVTQRAVRRISADHVVAGLKDRVRFAIETPEQNYGVLVKSALDDLAARGYAMRTMESFWGDGEIRRHYGLNVALVDPAGFALELQFPTPASRAVGKQAHDLDEILRVRAEAGFEYAHAQAFLNILAINKKAGMAHRQPEQLALLPQVIRIDSTLTRWLAQPRGRIAWKRFLRWVEAESGGFDRYLTGIGLTRADIPEAGRPERW